VPNNLLPQRSSSVDREREREEIIRRLQDPKCRLITLIGPGGIGKTHLAVQVAKDLLEFEESQFPDGIYFVPLAAVGNPNLIFPTLAGALKLTISREVDLRTQLLGHLHMREMLLIMDNFEHLIVEGTHIIREILEEASGVTFLVTSRERLHLPEEWIFDLRGLSYPKTEEISTQELEDYGAIRLFVEKAEKLHAGFSLQEEGEAVASICRSVEGNPLALELAASWVRVLSCREIVQEIKKSLDFLRTSHLPGRHRSLRAVFEGSWKLLNGEERKVLCKLAVFRGGFSREAAEKVAEATPSTLMALIDKSFLQRAGSGRYELHELLRQYAQEQLERHPRVRVQTQTKHAEYYAQFLEEHEDDLRGPQQQEVLEEIEKELSNLRTALEWSLNEEPETGLRLAGVLWWYWSVRGDLNEGRLWLEKLLNKGIKAKASLRAKVLCGAGFLALDHSDYERASELCEEGLRIYRDLKDEAGEAFALGVLGYVARYQDDYEKATQLLEDSLRHFRKLGDKWGIAYALVGLGEVAMCRGETQKMAVLWEESLALWRELNDELNVADVLVGLGYVAWLEGDYEQAEKLCREGLNIRRRLRDQKGIAIALRVLGLVALDREDYKQAWKRLEESLSLFREVGDQHAIGLALQNLGLVALRQKEYAQAVRLYRESLEVFRELDHRWGIAFATGSLAHAAREQGELDRAETLYQEAIGLWYKLGNVRGLAGMLEGLAKVARAQGDAERAVRLLASAEGLREPVGSTRPVGDRASYERELGALRAELGDRFEVAWAEGRAFDLERAVTYALEDD